MINRRAKKIAGIAVVVLAVGGGAYLAGAKARCAGGSCDAKVQTAALTSSGQTTCEKVHASTVAANASCDAKAATAATASTNGSCDAKVRTTAVTDAEACSYLKSHAVKAAAASAKEGERSEGTCPMSGNGFCPMEKGAKGDAAKRNVNQKAEPKGVMVSVVPSPASSR